uniref:Uncharacterized protein n=1 Tax=viral metagenome TaxID=1070528 RepID=A0A6H2A446_9ZZZZ
MSPELGTQVREGADNVELNIPYEITNIEDVQTEVKAYAGVRVELLSPKGHIGSIMLWKRPVVGHASKLGCMIDLLGSNTDRWLHKWIILRGWELNNRVVQLTAAPVAKSTKATTAKGVAKVANEAKKKGG